MSATGPRASVAARIRLGLEWVPFCPLPGGVWRWGTEDL